MLINKQGNKTIKVAEKIEAADDDDTYPVVVEVVDGLGQVITQVVLAAKYTEARGDKPRGIDFSGVSLSDCLGLSEERRVELGRQGGTIRIWPTTYYMDIPLVGPHMDPGA